MTDKRLGLTPSLLCLLFVAASPAAAQKQDWRGYPADEWPLAGGRFGQTRPSSLRQMPPDHVDRSRGEASVTELGGGELSRSTVAVRAGLMVLNTGRGIRALDAATGEEHWRHAALVGRMNKGVALGSGLVFAGLSDSSLIPTSAICTWPRYFLNPACHVFERKASVDPNDRTRSFGA